MRRGSRPFGQGAGKGILEALAGICQELPHYLIFSYKSLYYVKFPPFLLTYERFCHYNRINVIK
ncbi:hypothetical protein DXB04_04425 [Enterocloster bolteae]|nr:hypothetical protein DXB04_04425 [Enterocloster bolteae]